MYIDKEVQDGNLHTASLFQNNLSVVKAEVGKVKFVLVSSYFGIIFLAT